MQLRKDGLNVAQMHSDLSQEERNHVMLDFKAGRTDLIIATDIISRGIDIDDIQLVVNYDVPHDAEDYVHRIGRTARANRDGQAITLVNQKDYRYLKRIEELIEMEIEKPELPEGCGEKPQMQDKKQSAKKKNHKKHYPRKRSQKAKSKENT